MWAQRRVLALAWSGLVLAVLGAGLLAYATRPSIPAKAAVAPRLHAVSVADVDALARTLEAAGLLAALQSGTVQALPRLGLSRIPRRWTELGDVDKRKRLFIATMLPLVLAANESIAHDRDRLAALLKAGAAPSPAARAWIRSLAAGYRTDPNNLNRLLARVDTIPPSLALAQAAIESGWGTSRFARQGNALFGQWTWDPGAGLKPRRARDELGDYAIKRYASLYASVADYMRNLNTQKAYAEFRQLRARQRAKGGQPSGSAMAATLRHYSEEGAAYVRKLVTVIKTNNLTRLDNARLAR